MRRPLTVTLIAAIAALLAGCGKSDDTGTKISALEARLDRIEKRLGPRGGPPPAFGALEEKGKGPRRRLPAGGGRAGTERAAGPAAPPPPSPGPKAATPPQP